MTQAGSISMALAAMLVLGACAEREVILPGQREDIRAVLSTEEIPETFENQSRALSLPAATRNAEWAQFWGTPSVRTAHPRLSSSPSLAWQANIGQGNARRARITSAPVIGDGRIYTLDSGATIRATSTSGATLWSRDLTPDFDRAGDASGGGVSFANGRVYVTSGYGTLSVLNASDGEVIWEQRLQSAGNGAPTVIGDLVYLTSGDETGWALDAETGRIQWQIGSVGDVSNVMGAPAPVVSDGLALFAFGNGDVQAVFQRGGLRRWDSTIAGARRGYAISTISDITAGPVVDGERVYVGNQSGRAVALSLSGGERLWTATEGTTGPIWPAGDSVFFVTDQQQLVRLSKADGEMIWAVNLPGFVKDRPRRRAAVFAHFGPVLAGGQLWVASTDGLLRRFDPTDGSLNGTIAIDGGAATPPAVAGGTLYVVSTRGQLLAYR